MQKRPQGYNFGTFSQGACDSLWEFRLLKINHPLSYVVRSVPHHPVDRGVHGPN